MEHPEAQASPAGVDAAPVPWAPGPDAAVPVLAPRAKRRMGVVLAWCAGALAVIVLAALAAFVHASADETFDAAQARLEFAAEEEADAHRALTAAVSAAERSVLSGERIVAAASEELVHPDARSALGEALATLSGGADEARAVLEDEVDDGDVRKPMWMWELFAEASALDERREAATSSAEDSSDVERTLDDRHDRLTETAVALYASTIAAADALEAANVSARAAAVLDFRDAADRVAQQDGVGSDAAVAFSLYATNAEILASSAQSELAEKAGPLLATRLEIEAYARSIAGGVVLDFDWAPVVAGTGGSRGIGGTAAWNSARGGSSTITLSHSVAEWWPNADSRALVTHEVGHAITSKCHDRFDSQDRDANEEWATAWAISMGHTAQGNGVQAYGHPSQEMIDLAATCR
ncbi:hypothetical protein [Microbacterium sp. CPCC 204701]|uniref:hypothetical protein n=1 Tax=Microbacterium sp. CPCC 204701 TaxID=2493084 RepID=UPI000FDBD258|nr:hypothetical protein [Microbacterium sp. CPCC 204701]